MTFSAFITIIILIFTFLLPVRATAKEDKNWTLRYDLSYQKTSGNKRSYDLRTGIELAMKKDKNSLTLTASYAKGKTGDEVSADKMNFILKYNRMLAKKAYGATFLLYEKDLVRDIKRRWQVGPTIGYKFYDTKTLLLSSDLGAIWDETTNIGGDTESEFKGLWNIDSSYIPATDLKLEEKIRWTQESQDFELNSETGLYVPVYKRLFLKISLIEHYNTHPGENLQKNDLTLLASLSYLVHF